MREEGYHNKWYAKNKDRLQEKNKTRLTCEICGCTVSLGGKYQHLKSAKHKAVEKVLKKNGVRIKNNFIV